MTKRIVASKTATVETPEYLRPFIPQLDQLKPYVPREVSPGVTDAEFLDFVWRSNKADGYCARNGQLLKRDQVCAVDLHEGDCLYTPQNKLNVAIVGPTGTGKTSGLVNFAARHNLPMFTVNPDISAHAAFGQYVPDPDTGGLRWVNGPVWMIAEHGGLLYLDEINFFDPAVQAVFFGVFDFRRAMTLMEHPIKAVCDEHGMLQSLDDDILGIDHRKCAGIRRWVGPLSIPLHPATLVVSSYNPGGAYAGTNPVNAALANRFATMNYDYDTDVEEQILRCASIAALGKALRLVDTIRTPVSTNRLERFEQLIQTTNDYGLAKRFFLADFPVPERDEVDTIMTNQFEVTNKVADGGILAFFSMGASEDETVLFDDES